MAAAGDDHLAAPQQAELGRPSTGTRTPGLVDCNASSASGGSPPPRTDGSCPARGAERWALTQSAAIEVKRVRGKGRGVFARRSIAEGEVIESCPVLVVPAEEVRNGAAWTRLGEYRFDWGRGTVALALGYGSLYNHSYEPNAHYEDIGGRTKLFVALRDIQRGEEITVNYNGEPEDRSPVWFDVIDDPGPGEAGATGGHGGVPEAPYPSGAQRAGPGEPLATRAASVAHDSNASASASTCGTSSSELNVCRSLGRNGPISPAE